MFAGEKCKEEFADFLFTGENSLVGSGEYYSIIGHNAARFDSFFFILQAICDESSDDPNIFFDGKVQIINQN